MQITDTEYKYVSLHSQLNYSTGLFLTSSIELIKAFNTLFNCCLVASSVNTPAASNFLGIKGILSKVLSDLMVPNAVNVFSNEASAFSPPVAKGDALTA